GPMPISPGLKRKLDGGCGLARALEPGEQQHRGRPVGVGKATVVAAQKSYQLLVNDLDDLLWRGQILADFDTDELRADTFAELLDDLVVHVCFEQRHSDLAQGRVHIIWAQHTPPREPLQNRSQAVAEVLEHQIRTTSCSRRVSRRRMSARSRASSALASRR